MLSLAGGCCNSKGRPGCLGSGARAESGAVLVDEVLHTQWAAGRKALHSVVSAAGNAIARLRCHTNDPAPGMLGKYAWVLAVLLVKARRRIRGLAERTA
jgi:hypothetical protein